MDGFSYLEGRQVCMHPNIAKGNGAVIRWTSPIAGTVVVYGRFTAACFCVGFCQ